MKKFTVAMIVLCGMIIVPVWPANAGIIPIDLNDFFADPTVNVSADGSSAIMAEDPFISPVLLSNDPGLGDPNVILPGPGIFLSFTYDFIEPGGNDDEFGAFVIDADTGLSIGSQYEFFTDVTGAGTISFDLSAPLLATLELGLQFQLSALNIDSGLDSTVTVSNVKLTSAAAPVPEPATVVLVGTGLFGLLGLGRKKLRT